MLTASTETLEAEASGVPIVLFVTPAAELLLWPLFAAGVTFISSNGLDASHL